MNNSIPWLLVAVAREHFVFRRRVPIEQTLRNRPTSIWRCRWGDTEFLLGETGVGGVMVERTLDWLAERHSPRSIFLAGFAGALADDLRVGDGVRARSSIRAASGVATWLLDLPHRAGTLLTSDRLLASPAEKALSAATHGALAVDMETSYMAAWCERRAVPWGCVRVVSDDARTPVSKDVFELLEDGRVSPWRLIKGLARRPALMRELIHLQRATNAAAAAIADAFTDVLRLVESKKAEGDRE